MFSNKTKIVKKKLKYNHGSYFTFKFKANKMKKIRSNFVFIHFFYLQRLKKSLND